MRILEEVEKEIEKLNKSLKESGSGEIKLPDLVRSKIRDLERNIETLDENCRKSKRLLDEVEREMDRIGVDFSPIRKDIESDITNLVK